MIRAWVLGIGIVVLLAVAVSASLTAMGVSVTDTRSVIRALLVAVAIVFLEWARLSWHARENWTLLTIHGVLAAGLAASWASWLAPVAALTVFGSWLEIGLKRRGHWAGVGLSGLSSLPWEGAALVALGWPDGLGWIWPSPNILVGLPAAYVSGWVWVTRRPAHWTKSRWVWAYWWVRP